MDSEPLGKPLGYTETRLKKITYSGNTERKKEVLELSTPDILMFRGQEDKEITRSSKATSMSENRADTGSRRTKNVIYQKPYEYFKKEETINSNTIAK